MLILLRSLLFYLLWMIWTLTLGMTVIVLVFMPVSWSWAVAILWVRGIMVLLRYCCGLTYELRGLEHLHHGPVIIASKHQSAWETFILLVLSPRPAFVLKRELLRIPIFGQYLAKLRMIAIDRSSGEKAVQQMLDLSRAVLAEGRSVIIFPEGTRTAPGADTRYRRRGVTALYHNLDAPIIPVALNSGLYWRRNALRKYPGTILLECLPPLDAGLDEAQLVPTLKHRIEAKTAALIAEAQAAHPEPSPYSAS